VNGPWLNNGTFTKATYTVTFGSANAAINNGSGTSGFNNLAVSSGASLAINETVTVSGNFSMPASSAVTRVNIGTAASLTVSGSVTMARPGTNGRNVMAVGDGTLTAGTFTMNATTTANTRHDSLTINNGSATVTGNFTHGTTGCIFRFYGSGTLNLGGTLSGTNVGFTAGSGTVNFNRAGAQTIWNVTYNNLTLSGSGNKTCSASATVNGVLSRQGTAAITTAAPQYGASSSLEYKGSSSQTTGLEFPTAGPGSGGIIINNANGVVLNATKSIGTKPITIGSTVANSLFSDGGFQLTATGTLTITSGTFRLGAANATTYPVFTANNFTAGTTVEYASAAAQTVSVVPSYQGLTFSGNGAKTVAAGTIRVDGDWSITGGTAMLGTNNSNAIVAGDITGSGGITMGAGTIGIGGNWTNNGAFTAGTGTVDYNNAVGGQTICGLAYNELTLSNSSGTQTASGNITAETFNTTADGRFNMGVNTLDITGTVNHAGILLTQNTGTTPLTEGKTWGGTVMYNGGPVQTIVHGNYNNLDGTGGERLLSTAGVIGVAGAFIPGSGIYSVAGSTVDFNGPGTQDIPSFTFGSLKISNAGIKRILGNIVVGCSSLDVQGTASLSIDGVNAGKLNVQ
jgi:hypothetical protein